jgi:hypothetical protein
MDWGTAYNQQCTSSTRFTSWRAWILVLSSLAMGLSWVSCLQIGVQCAFPGAAGIDLEGTYLVLLNSGGKSRKYQ